MTEKVVDRVVGRRKLLFTQSAVHELVTSAAKQGEPAGEFGFFEAAFGLPLAMTGTRNQVMPGEFDLGALA